MAKKKSSSKKSTTRKTTKTKASKPKAPAAPTYDEVITARREMEAAQAQVYTADRKVRSAYATHDDFKLRDQRTAEARAELNRARNRAAAATERFQDLKRKRATAGSNK